MRYSQKAHALLSASGASRWMVCPPSARLEEQAKEESSIYAKEGTFMHGLSELHLYYFLNRITKTEFNKRLKKMKENKFYTSEMESAVQNYIDVVIERINTARANNKDPLVLIEERLDYSPWVPEGFGTGDVLIISDGTLEVIDLKGGKGVKVAAGNNPQLRLYALGAINSFGMLYDIKKVVMTIIQPRLDNVSLDETPADELISWGETIVKPIADLAFKGRGEFKPGEHCRFCKVRFTCRARADEHLKLAQHDFKKPPLLNDGEITEILAVTDALQSWVSDVQAYALDQAVNHDKKWPGYKLIEGRSYRRYADETQAAGVLKRTQGDGSFVLMFPDLNSLREENNPRGRFFCVVTH